MVIPSVSFLEFKSKDVSFNANITDILTVFPRLDYLFISCFHSTKWITEMMQVEQHVLKLLKIMYDGLTEFDDFNFNAFLKFIKAQRPGFHVMLTEQTCISNHFKMSKKYELFTSKLRKCLDQNLVQDLELYKRKYRTIVHIVKLNFNFEDFYWHVPVENECLPV
uniref:FBD domain-containing protein n=1 Tax=Panagrellus redivivus TaxID=6233 RepID=A0A7E4V0C9_PANRE